jgi:predicted PurR-regulated permease PerM
MPTSSATSGWRSRDVLRITLLVVGVLLVLRLFWVAQEIFFLAFVGVLFGLTLAAAVDKTERFRIPRGVAAPILLLLVLGCIAGLASFAAPQVTSQLQEVKDQVPKVAGKVRGWIDSRVGGVTKLLSDSASKAATDSTSDSDSASKATDTTGKAADSTRAPAPDSTAVGAHRTGKSPAKTPEADEAGASKGVTQLSPPIGSVGRAFFKFFSSTLAAIGGTILIIFMTLFIAIDPKLYQRGLMHLLPHRHRERMEEVLSKVGMILRRWLVTQLIAMVVIGLVTGLAMWALGIRGAIALGVIAGLLEFIPFVGPIASAVPAIAMGLLDSPEKAIYVAIAFTVIQQSEGHVLIPLLMKDSLNLPPVLTILSQAVMATVFGFLGLLVAVPLLAMVMVAVKMLYVEDVVGDELGAG